MAVVSLNVVKNLLTIIKINLLTVIKIKSRKAVEG